MAPQGASSASPQRAPATIVHPFGSKSTRWVPHCVLTSRASPFAPRQDDSRANTRTRPSMPPMLTLVIVSSYGPCASRSQMTPLKEWSASLGAMDVGRDFTCDERRGDNGATGRR